MRPPLLLFGGFVRAAVDFAGGMLVAAILGVLVPELIGFATVSPYVGGGADFVVWARQTETWYPFVVLLGGVLSLVARSIVEGSVAQ